eukprot:CAMPEP_0179221108 /NCGR_PEP_ID=MMETSP0797-20121207/6006_1 /TAXON_ID=47934 /ORGANISM="Dinophysis acuminata, Strain DAEP01" /LENGTH=210 /DNA_ID=CAMNT_0020927851 /DNA_START=15 /DNA_END=644 /DNA_ORIENTATION=+
MTSEQRCRRQVLGVMGGGAPVTWSLEKPQPPPVNMPQRRPAGAPGERSPSPPGGPGAASVAGRVRVPLHPGGVVVPRRPPAGAGAVGVVGVEGRVPPAGAGAVGVVVGVVGRVDLPARGARELAGDAREDLPVGLHQLRAQHHLVVQVHPVEGAPQGLDEDRPLAEGRHFLDAAHDHVPDGLLRVPQLLPLERPPLAGAVAQGGADAPQH